MSQSTEIKTAVERTAARLVQTLGENLHSCILYGSAVRGEMVDKVSDINLLIVLTESTPAAHSAIADAIAGNVLVDTFIVGRRGMERSMRAFAPKFLSIRRDYRVLHGEDFLADFEVDEQLRRFLCEQAIRNHRLRVVHAYVTMRDKPKRYTEFVQHVRTPLLIQLSEAMRLAGIEFPHPFSDRMPVIQREMNVDVSVLGDLANSRARRRPFSSSEIQQHHARLFQLLDRAVLWIEEKWPNP